MVSNRRYPSSSQNLQNSPPPYCRNLRVCKAEERVEYQSVRNRPSAMGRRHANPNREPALLFSVCTLLWGIDQGKKKSGSSCSGLRFSSQEKTGARFSRAEFHHDTRHRFSGKGPPRRTVVPESLAPHDVAGLAFAGISLFTLWGLVERGGKGVGWRRWEWRWGERSKMRR